MQAITQLGEKIRKTTFFRVIFPWKQPVIKNSFDINNFMKKTFFLLTMVTMVLMRSCTGQDVGRAIEDVIDEKLYVKFTGQLYVKETKENSLLIFCKTDPSAGHYDKAFAIFSERPIPKMWFSEQDVFEVQIPDSRRFAIVYNKTRDQLHFIGLTDVSARISSIKAKKEVARSVTNQDYLGYGLSFLSGVWDVGKVKGSSYKYAFTTLDYADVKNAGRVIPPEDEGGYKFCKRGACTSGGAGSTSCSISEDIGPVNQSCTSSCGAGYYACCDSSVTRCYCCKNG
jgi:hypothetical protein